MRRTKFLSHCEVCESCRCTEWLVLDRMIADPWMISFLYDGRNVAPFPHLKFSELNRLKDCRILINTIDDAMGITLCSQLVIRACEPWCRVDQRTENFPAVSPRTKCSIHYNRTGRERLYAHTLHTLMQKNRDVWWIWSRLLANADQGAHKPTFAFAGQVEAKHGRNYNELFYSDYLKYKL